MNKDIVMKRIGRIGKYLMVMAVVGTAALFGLPGGALSDEVSYQRLLNADKEPNNWLMYYGDYRGWRYSALSQINTTNVKRLVVKWVFSTGPDEGLQVTPLVADGVMYFSNGKNQVFALDAATGKILWRYNHELPGKDKMPWGIWGQGVSRGVSVADGKVLMATWDAHLVALDARTGKLLWKNQVADYEEGQGFTSPPLIVKDKAIIGLATWDFPGRGFIDAYDLASGKQVWRFYTIPGPGEPGNETWGPGEAWKYGSAGAWMPGTYDPQLNLIYLGTSQPSPSFDGEARPGDNLYSSSILALDPDSGKLKWYFQTVPHDVWEFDAIGERVLVDTEIQGKPAKALLQAGKNGYFYALDRTNGRFLYARPFVSRVTWTKGLDDNGRPIPAAVPTPEGAVLCPSWFGGKSWNSIAYHPQTGYVYIPTIDICGVTKLVRVKPRKGALFLGGDVERYIDPHGRLVAIDVKTGQTKWEYRSSYPMLSSVLATAGGLVLTGDLEGNALAFDASKGELLWSFNTGAGHRSSPITYAVKGRQYIAVPSGIGPPWTPLSWIDPKLKDMPLASTIFVFGLFED